MPTVRNSQIDVVEELHGRIAELQSEADSLADDLADAYQMIELLRAEHNSLMLELRGN